MSDIKSCSAEDRRRILKTVVVDGRRSPQSPMFQCHAHLLLHIIRFLFPQTCSLPQVPRSLPPPHSLMLPFTRGVQQEKTLRCDHAGCGQMVSLESYEQHLLAHVLLDVSEIQDEKDSYFNQ